MDLLLHPMEDPERHRPDGTGRLSTVGHRAAFRAFARAAKRAGVRFMVIGGTFRDVALRAASTHDIDIVLVDRKELDPAMMDEAGFVPVPGSPHAWRYSVRGRTVDLEVAATASSERPRGPFSVAYQHAETAKIEGLNVTVPCLEDYVILKLIAAAADRRRRGRDLADVRFAVEAHPRLAHSSLSVASVRKRLRELYGFEGERLKDLVALFRTVTRTR